MKTGDAIMVIYGDERLPGTLLLCSANERSLFVEFDGHIGGHVGGMPLIRFDDDEPGVYHTLIGAIEVIVRPLKGRDIVKDALLTSTILVTSPERFEPPPPRKPRRKIGPKTAVITSVLGRSKVSIRKKRRRK